MSAATWVENKKDLSFKIVKQKLIEAKTNRSK